MKHLIKKITNKLINLPSRVINFKRKKYWLKGAYYTLRYVDDYNEFPCIIFTSPMKLRIDKAQGSKLIIKKRLILEPWLSPNGKIWMNLGGNSTLLFENDFVLGDNIKIFLAHSSTFKAFGKEKESASGITASCTILVYKYLEIGKDCIIAWDTFLTDCDWHKIEGKKTFEETIIGDKVWIGVGTKVLKGAKIGANSIITTNSVVLKGIYKERSMISGIPAKVISENINDWHRDM